MQSTSSAFERTSNGIGENKKTNKNRKHWTHSEDLKLRELVAVSGPKKWKHIAKNIPGRTDIICRARWFNYLDQRLNKTPFSDWEDQKLLEEYNRLGNKWTLIGKVLHNRTCQAVKKRWVKLMRQKSKQPSTSDSRESLIVSPHANEVAEDERNKFLKEEKESSSSQDILKAKLPPKFIDFLGVGDS